MRLVIVESPNKTRKIASLLGSDFTVVATAGHFRDLPDDDLAVDVGTFTPRYEVRADKRGLVTKIGKLAEKASEVLLATDADREGEAIAWHLVQALHLRRARRVRFQEITEAALQRAVATSGPVDQHLVDAQQARRVLDRLVGYQVSPLLAPFGRNHSAGRVQSATLHLVVARELEREQFKVTPYWTAAATYAAGFAARAATLDDQGELQDTRFATEAEANGYVARAAASTHLVANVETKPVERRAPPPFTTSTLLQASSSRLGLKPDQTMAAAQRLFEGGLITYHRTDSVALGAEAVAAIRAVLAHDYPEALPPEPPKHVSKATAQEAHEAIRPTEIEVATPGGLTGDDLALYQLIRAQTLACQCKPSVTSRTTVTIAAGDSTWRARGSVVVFASFLRFLGPSDEEESNKEEERGQPRLPALATGQDLGCPSFEVKRRETQPPPRYTQATLVRAMEQSGIGRPSTYASTRKVLFEREYLAEEDRKLYPTARGRLVHELLGRGFPELLETKTTAALEERLDLIAAGKLRWKDELRSWYGPFSGALSQAPAAFDHVLAARPELRAAVPGVPKALDRDCPKCGKPLRLRTGKGGDFVACSAWPDCDYASNPSAAPSDQACPKCQGKMEEQEGKGGRSARCLDRACGGRRDLSPLLEQKCPACDSALRDRGDYLACSSYPVCRATLDKKALARALKTGARCPKCERPLLERKGARGKFLGCSGYPRCTHTASLEKVPATGAGTRDGGQEGSRAVR